MSVEIVVDIVFVSTIIFCFAVVVFLTYGDYLLLQVGIIKSYFRYLRLKKKKIKHKNPSIMEEYWSKDYTKIVKKDGFTCYGDLMVILDNGRTSYIGDLEIYKGKKYKSLKDIIDD